MLSLPVFSTLSNRMCAETKRWRAPRQFRHLLYISKSVFSHLSGFAQSRFSFACCTTQPSVGVVALHRVYIRRGEGCHLNYVHRCHGDSLFKYLYFSTGSPLLHVSTICCTFIVLLFTVIVAALSQKCVRWNKTKQEIQNYARNVMTILRVDLPLSESFFSLCVTENKPFCSFYNIGAKIPILGVCHL